MMRRDRLMAPIGIAPVVPITDPADAREQNSELLWLMRALLSRWKSILVLTVLMTVVAALAIRHLPPSYTGTAEILIDFGETEYSDLGGRTSRQGMIWPAEMETYIKLFSSDQLALDVVDKVGLAAFPVSVQPWTPYVAPIADLARGLLDRATVLAGDILGESPSLPPTTAPVAPAASAGAGGNKEEEAVAVFRDRLHVMRDPMAQTITVSYRADDPLLAARVANETASTFLTELVRTQKVSLASTTDYLRDRVTILGQELDTTEASNRSLQNDLYKAQGGSPVAEARYGELMRALSDAQAELANARSQSTAYPSLDDKFSNPVTEDLRRQKADLARKLAEMASDFGANHPMMTKLRAQIAEIDKQLGKERAGVRQTVGGDVTIAQAKVTWLQGEISKLEQQLLQSTDAQARLKQVVAQTEATRRTYEEMLKRYQLASEQQYMLRAPARILSNAQIPDQRDSKKSLLILGFTACASIALGMGLAALREFSRRGYATLDEVMADTKLPAIGTLPMLSARSVSRLAEWKPAEAKQRVFVEAIRRASLRAHADHERPAGPCEVIVITSALPNEGKTTVSLSLARHLAHNGRRTLLVDADLRRRSLGTLIKTDTPPESGLATLLASPDASFEDAVLRDVHPDLDLLFADRCTDEPERLLGSPRMADLVAQWRRRYDVVVIDTPPVLAASDHALLSPLADRLLFIVRWQTTQRNAVRTALKDLMLANHAACQLVLNCVKLRAYSKYASADHLAYHDVIDRYNQTSRG